MRTRRRAIRIAVISLLLICAMFVLLLIIPASRGQKGMQVRWTGKLSMNMQEQRYFVHGEEEHFETEKRYNIGQIQIVTHKKRRD